MPREVVLVFISTPTPPFVLASHTCYIAHSMSMQSSVAPGAVDWGLRASQQPTLTTLACCRAEVCLGLSPACRGSQGADLLFCKVQVIAQYHIVLWLVCS
jgi:hypothetical protein